MNDRLSPGGQQAMTGEQQGIDRPPTVTVAEAAARLGLSADAIRGRLQRGTLPGVKVDGVWCVTLPDDVPHTTGIRESQQATTGQQQATAGDRQAIDGAPTGYATGTDLAPLAALIDDLTAQVRDLSAAAAMWQTRAAHLDDQLKQLSTGGSDQREGTESPESVGDRANVETYRAHTDTGTASVLARLKQWIRGHG